MGGGGPGGGRPKHLLMVGAGHAHLDVVRGLRGAGVNGHRATLVSPEDFWYSGLATGMLGGDYAVDDDRIDVAALAERSGFAYVRDSVEAIDPKGRVATLAGGDEIRYDVASLDVGSRVPVEEVPGLGELAFAVKPIRRLAELRADIERRLGSAEPGSGRGELRALVVGGGPTATEVALNLRSLADRLGRPARVTIVCPGDRPLTDWPERASRAASMHLRRRRVNYKRRSRVVRVEPGLATTDRGDRIGFDVIVASIGLKPSPLIGRLGLPIDEDGALRTDPYLRSVAEPTLFGAGDCAALDGHRLPRVGVVAVRQAEVLRHNLRAALESRRLRRYRPQRRFLLILNLGGGIGLGSWGPFWCRGRGVLWLKDFLDRSYLRRFQ